MDHDEVAVQKYIKLELHCSHDFRCVSLDLDKDRVADACRMRLTQATNKDLWESLRAHTRNGTEDWNSNLDLATRQLSKYGTTTPDSNPVADAECTLCLLNERSINPYHDPYTPEDKPVPKALAVARSLAAYAYHQKFAASAEDRAALRGSGVLSDAAAHALRDLFSAATYALLAARAGFVSLTVANVGMAFRSLVTQLGIGKDAEVLGRFRPLMEAVEVYERAAFMNELFRNAEEVGSVFDPPLCAAEGCPFEAARRSDLLAYSLRAVLVVCEGQCDPAFKPTYCSHECMQQDFGRHAIVCGPDRHGEMKIALPASVSLNAQTLQIMLEMLTAWNALPEEDWEAEFLLEQKLGWCEMDLLASLVSDF